MCQPTKVEKDKTAASLRVIIIFKYFCRKMKMAKDFVFVTKMTTCIETRAY